MPLAGVILAAGRSARMGTPKALLDFRGAPFVVRILEALEALDLKTRVVVVGPDAGRIRPALATHDGLIEGLTSTQPRGRPGLAGRSPPRPHRDRRAPDRDLAARAAGGGRARLRRAPRTPRHLGRVAVRGAAYECRGRY